MPRDDAEGVVACIFWSMSLARAHRAVVSGMADALAAVFPP